MLGYSGNTGNSTGAHLHFEVRTNLDNCSTCVDPLPLLRKETISPVVSSDGVVTWAGLNIRTAPALSSKTVGAMINGDTFSFDCGETYQADGYTWQPVIFYVAKEGLGE